MAKILMELHEGSLLDLFGNQYIMSGKPAVAENTSLVNGAISAGKGKVLAQLKDEATQEILNKYLEEDKLKDFIAKYDINAKAPEAPKAAPASVPAPKEAPKAAPQVNNFKNQKNKK